MKVAIYYDNMFSYGGAERLALLLARSLNADIITSGYGKDIQKWNATNTVKIIDIGNFTINYSKPLSVLFESPIRFFLYQKQSSYDINIFLGFSSIFASNKKNKNIFYCLVPNRLFYDKESVELKNFSFIQRFILKIYKLFYKVSSEEIIKNNMDTFITQSKNTQNKIKEVYNKDSKIIFSPIDTSQYQCKNYENFYLSVGRLYPEKRFDLLVDVFKDLPEKKLIIVGDGPEGKNLISRIGRAKNITIKPNVSDGELRQLYSTCLATLYFPKDEDFGLIPLEGMASGKPAIAVNEGGCKETIIDGKTGYLLNPRKQEIIDFVQKFTPIQAKKMKNYCILQAQKYDIRSYKKEILKVLASLS